ncbi:MAG: hypothetical protein EA357_08250 [Micavibrio sp.]|nr:MAG: hypothetical protein EA357_08250 [Micavibrio sp.]
MRNALKRNIKHGKTLIPAFLLAAGAASPALGQSHYHPEKTEIDNDMRQSAAAFAENYRLPDLSALRANGSCTNTGVDTPVIKLVTDWRTPVYDRYSSTIADLTEQFSSNGEPLDPNTRVLGLNSPRLNYTASLHSEMRTPAGGAPCLTVTEVTVNVTLLQDIKIASDLLDHSCYAESVKTHEDLHAIFNTKAMKNFAPLIERFGRDMGREMTGTAVPDGKTATDVATEMSHTFLQMVGDILNGALDAAQEKHDILDDPANSILEMQHRERQCGYRLPLS